MSPAWDFILNPLEQVFWVMGHESLALALQITSLDCLAGSALSAGRIGVSGPLEASIQARSSSRQPATEHHGWE